MFGVVEFIFFLKHFKQDFSLSLKRMAVWTIFALAPLIFWQISTFLIKRWIYTNPSYTRLIEGSSGEGAFFTYIGHLIKQVSSTNRQTGYHGNLLFYVEIILKKEGILLLSFLILGLFFVLKDALKKPYKNNNFVFSLYFFIPLSIWSLYSHYPTNKTFCVAIPAIAVISSFSFRSLFDKNPFFLVLFLMFIIAFQLSNTIPLLSYTSGFPAAINYMKSHKGVKHLSSNPHISRAYVNKDDVIDMSFSFREKEFDPTGKLHISLEKLKEFYKKRKFQYLLLDQFRYTNPNEIFKASVELIPLFSTPHTTTAFFYDSRKEYQGQILNNDKKIEVFDLGEIIKGIEKNVQKK